MLTQQDIVEQRVHPDAVSFGGWAIDLHPADGVFSAQPGCTQWHSKGVYQIPWRCLYSRNIRNLFLAGRIISASHVAFACTRVMATCAHGGQAVGMAAALCLRDRIEPARPAGTRAHGRTPTTPAARRTVHPGRGSDGSRGPRAPRDDHRHQRTRPVGPGSLRRNPATHRVLGR